MRASWALGITFATAVAAGCSGSGQVNGTQPTGSSEAGSAGTKGETGGSNTGGAAGSDTGKTGGSAGSETGMTGGSSAGGTGGAGNTGGTSAGGTSAGGTSAGGTGGAGGCMPLSMDDSHIHEDCKATMMCPPGYTCFMVLGAITTYSCELLCTQDCECPSGLICKEKVIEGGQTWKQCEKP